MSTLSEKLSQFVVESKFEDLPADVVYEAKRVLLDSIGCALGGIATDKGKISIELARRLGGPPESSIFGVGDKVSCANAAFTNTELINAMDYDAVTTWGHVTHYVIPPPLAVAQSVNASGRELILATVLGHELSMRIANGGIRRNGVTVSAFGFTMCIMGAVAGTGKILKLDPVQMTHAFGIAGHFCPVPTFAKWATTKPVAMTKYGSGWLSNGAVTAALLAEMGYIGDTTVFEGDHGFKRFIGVETLEPDMIMDKIGEKWHFLRIHYKPYPCGRVWQAPLDGFRSIIEQNNLSPGEIDSVKVQIAGPMVLPIWASQEINNHVDAEFSVPYAFAASAHRVRREDWQDWGTLNNPKVLAFMKKVSCQGLPEDIYRQFPPRGGYGGVVEVVAKGKTFKDERLYARGSSHPDDKMTDEDLVNKFKGNASRILTRDKIEKAVKSLWELEKMQDVAELGKLITL